MHTKHSTSLRRLFRPILRFLGISSPPPYQLEFPVCMSVQDWELNLRDRYTSRDPVNSPNDRSRMRNHKVITIRRYKERKHTDYEYLVAKVSDPDLDQPRYLRIERSIWENLPLINPRSSQSSLLGPLEALNLKEHPARNYVMEVAKWPTRDLLVNNLNCKDSQMILLDLVLVVKVVSDHSGKYELFKRQSLWCADLVTAVLEQSFPQIKVVVRDPSLNENGEGAEREILDEKSGAYMKIPIYTRRMSMIQEICEGFVTYKREVLSWISKAAHDVEEARKEREERPKKMEEARIKTEMARIRIEVAGKEIEMARKEIEMARKEIEMARKETEVARKEKEVARKEIEVARKENEVAQKEIEMAQKEKEVAQSSISKAPQDAVEEAQREEEEAQKTLERVPVLKESADLKQRMQELEGKVTSGSGGGNTSV